MTDLEWEASPEKVVAKRTIGKHTVRFVATNFRVERSHKHATVAIFQDTYLLDEDDISIAKREERQRLMNSAYKALVEPMKTWTLAQSQTDFLTFLRTVWERWNDSTDVSMTHGTEQQPNAWLLAPYFIEGAGTILYAPPGSGKSWTALSMSISLDAGGSNIWTPQRQANVLYVNLERSEDSFARRIGALNEALGHERNRPLRMIHGRGKTLVDVQSNVTRAVKTHKIELIVVDSLSRAGSSLVDDHAANQTMDILNGFDKAFLTVGHTPRGDTNHVFGSQMFTAAADAEFKLEGFAQEGFLYQKLSLTKSNDFGWVSDQALVYTMDPEYGVTHVNMIDADDFPTKEEEQDKRKAGARELNANELAWIVDQGAVTPSMMAKHFGRGDSWASRILADSNYVEGNKQGRSIVYTPRREDT